MSRQSPGQAAKPSKSQYLRYVYGAKLPDEMRDWVAEDVVGRGGAVRMVSWFALPCLIIVTPMLFVEASWVIVASMMLLILIPFVFFSVALNRVYRRYRLQQHGLDPALLTARQRETDAEAYADYLHQTRHERERFIYKNQ